MKTVGATRRPWMSIRTALLPGASRFRFSSTAIPPGGSATTFPPPTPAASPASRARPHGAIGTSRAARRVHAAASSRTMFFVFLGLAVADLGFLAAWLLLGFQVHGHPERALGHQIGGLMTCILTVFAHSVTFVYFLGTGL